MFPSLAGWGVLQNTDQTKCWAETARNPEEMTHPCGKVAVSDLGLCPMHYQEITGREWEPENSQQAGAKQKGMSDAPN